MSNKSLKIANPNVQKHIKSDALWKKKYLDPLHASLRSCGCIYDTKTLKLTCLMRNDRTLIGTKHFSYITHKYHEKVYT